MFQLLRYGRVLLTAALPLHAGAMHVTRVKVIGVPSSAGSVECALFRDATGFASKPDKARVLRVPASAGAVICRSPDSIPAVAAIAVSHAANRNGRFDQNFLGIPKEAWGVTRNLRPLMRPPRFEEAAITHASDADLGLVVELKP